MTRTPRPYQIDVVDQVKLHWQAGRRSVMLALPTGAGKTMCAELVILPILLQQLAQVLFVAHAEVLLDQAAARFDSDVIRSSILKGARKHDADAPLQFLSAATAANRDIVPAKRADGTPYRRCIVVVDEAQRLKCETQITILNKVYHAFASVFCLMLSATPYRLDGRGYSDVCDAIVEPVTPRQLADAGVIHMPTYWSQPLPEREGDETDEALLSRAKVVGDVVKTWLLRARRPDAPPCDGTFRFQDYLPTVGRGCSIAHSRLLVQRFCAAGIRAEHVDGEMTAAERRRLCARLSVDRRHPLAVDILFSGSNVLDEGFDSRASWEVLEVAAAELNAGGSTRYPELVDLLIVGADGRLRPPPYDPLCVLVDAGATNSRGAFFQRLGRVVRSWLGDGSIFDCGSESFGSFTKTCARLCCHSGNLERFGFLELHCNFPLEGDKSWAPGLAKGAKETAGLHVPMPATCPACLCVDLAGTLLCRHCGAVLRQPVLPEERRGVELVEKSAATAEIVTSTPGTREAFLRARYREMAAANRERAAQGRPPYKDGWAAMRFKKQFGRWPDARLDALCRRTARFGVD